MDNSKIVSHRCKNLLEHNRISIRYNEGLWILYSLRYDFNYGTNYLESICTIEYCPYCGKRLAEENQTIIKESELGIPVIQGGGKTMREIYSEEYR